MTWVRMRSPATSRWLIEGSGQAQLQDDLSQDEEPSNFQVIDLRLRPSSVAGWPESGWGAQQLPGDWLMALANLQLGDNLAQLQDEEPSNFQVIDWWLWPTYSWETILLSCRMTWVRMRSPATSRWLILTAFLFCFTVGRGLGCLLNFILGKLLWSLPPRSLSTKMSR